MLDDVIKKWGGHSVSPMDVYSSMYHLGEGLIQKENEPKGLHKTNPLGYYKNKEDHKGHYRIFFEDSFGETLKELQQADFAIMNGLTYFGRSNLMSNASKMYAMIFDLDGIDEVKLNNFFSGAFRANVYPVPNYVVLSGHGMHLYYLFEDPISLYPNIKLQLKEMKYALTYRMWNQYTSKDKKIQYQGINQGFRVIGGKTKIKNRRAKAYQVNTHPFSLQELCQFIPEKNRIDETKLWKESKLTLDQAKIKYPEWYEKRVVQKLPKDSWTCKRDLYEWWKRKINGDEVAVGHRYFCIMCLAIYGVKCGISLDEVKKDAKEFVPILNRINPGEPFTVEDAKSALECYDEKYVTFPIEDIQKLSGIAIQKNKRNGRKQAVHLQIMNSTRDILYPEGEWRNKDGRPAKQDLIQEWKQQHPEGSKADCNRDTKIDPKTIRKWWSASPDTISNGQLPENKFENG